MSSSKILPRRAVLAGALLGSIGLLSGCTVRPLEASASYTGDTPPALRAIAVEPVATREEQQVRNALLFALHGGTPPVEPRYRVKLAVESTVAKLAIPNDAFASSTAKLTMRTRYILSDAQTGATLGTGQQITIASLDKTSQAFANARAEREAANRAAAQAAQKIRLALARDLARP